VKRILPTSLDKENTMFFHQAFPKPPPSKAPPAFYRLRDVMRISALSRSTIYRRISEGRFPSPVRLGGRASAWPSAELQAWIDDPEGYRKTAKPPF
jgi:prophage regulatory protein